jgi:hypothetical protein
MSATVMSLVIAGLVALARLSLWLGRAGFTTAGRADFLLRQPAGARLLAGMAGTAGGRVDRLTGRTVAARSFLGALGESAQVDEDLGDGMRVLPRCCWRQCRAIVRRMSILLSIRDINKLTPAPQIDAAFVVQSDKGASLDVSYCNPRP